MLNQQEASILSLPKALFGALGEAVRVPHANFSHIVRHIRKEWRLFFLLRGIAKSERERKAGLCESWVSMEAIVDE